ncbi:MAG: protein kinase [Chloroflexota bacterium]
MTLQPDKIGPYDIKHSIGFGGFATVYLAYDSRLKRDIALKVMSEHLLQDPIFYERFMREVKTIAGLEHRAIVPIYDSDVHNQKPYLTMRYMRGGTLWDRLKDEGKLPLDEVVRITSRLAAGLDYAHSQQIVHRDIKPANILLDREGMPYLSDFGIARRNTTNPITKKNALVGSLPYMSPEQLKNEQILPQTDVYQFGVMMFELLTGRHPFIAEDVVAYLYLHTKEPIPSIHEVNPDLPAEVDEIIYKALAKDPLVRYESLSQIANDLIELAGKETTLTLKSSIQNLSKVTDAERFPGYEIVREIGRGHIGIVYLVKHLETNAELALKAIPHELLDDPKAIKHLRHQATIIPDLKHDAIVPVQEYRVGERSGRPYLVMDYMSGGNLGKVLSRKTPVSLVKAIQMIRRLALAMNEAHEAGIYHGDIKPSNILFDDQNRPYLVDFGLNLVLNHVTILTVSETAVGSPAYKAPERWLNQESSPSTDIYQLGVILFQLLTGQHPFKAEGMTDYQDQHINSPVPSATALNDDLPPSIDPFFAKAMAKKPEERFQTAEQFVAALNAVQKDKETIEEQIQLLLLIESADMAEKAEQWEEAMLSLSSILDIDPDFEGALVRMDEIHQKMQDEFNEEQRQKAQSFKQKFESEQFEYTYRAATTYFKQEKWMQAIDKFNEVLKLDPRHEPAQKQLEAAKIQQTLVQQYETANEYLKISNWERAIDALKEVQKIVPDYRDTESNLGLAQREFALAEQYSKVKRFYIENPTRLRRAREQFQALENERSGYKEVRLFLDEINQQIELDDLFERAIDLEKDERFKEAIVVMEQVTAVDGSFRHAEQKLDILRGLNEQAVCYSRGMQAIAQSQWDEAIDYFDQCDSFKDAKHKKEYAENQLFLETHYREAQQAIELEDWPMAEQCLIGIQGVDPSYKNVPELLEIVRAGLGKTASDQSKLIGGEQSNSIRFGNGRILIGIGMIAALIVLVFFFWPDTGSQFERYVSCLENDTAVIIHYPDFQQNLKQAEPGERLQLGPGETEMNIEVNSQECPELIDVLTYDWGVINGQIEELNSSKTQVRYIPDPDEDLSILQLWIAIEAADFEKPFPFELKIEE